MQPWDSWPGTCEGGRAFGATTSGFEGSWTETPITWSNKYFEYLRDFTFVKSTSPAGATQWEISPSSTISAPAAHGGGTVPVMMLTSDIALVNDASYKCAVKQPYFHLFIC